MKKCPKPLGYGIRRTPVVLGLSAALCMPAAFSYANVDNGMDRDVSYINPTLSPGIFEF